MDELKNSLLFPPIVVPTRNWPMAADMFPMVNYHRTPLKLGCKSYCDRVHCLSQLCLTWLLKRFYYPSSRVVSAPVSTSDLHLTLKLRKVMSHIIFTRISKINFNSINIIFRFQLTAINEIDH